MRKKVLIIRLSSLGDVVLSTSVPRVLKDKFDIYFLTKKEFSQILEDIPYINILSFNGTSDLLRLIKTIRNINPDYILDLQGKILTFIIRKTFDPSGKKTFIWDSQRFERRKAIFLKNFSSVKHMIFRFLEPAILILEKEGIRLNINSQEDILPKIFPPQRPEKDDIIRLVNTVVVAPESRWKTKTWNFSECNKFIEYLERNGFNVVVVGKDSKNSEIFSGSVKLFGNISLRDLKYIVSKALCVVSVDSAISHISSALRVPTISVFTSSDPQMGFYPTGSRVVMRENLRCRPCSLHGRDKCPAGHWLCTFVDHRKVSEIFFEVLRKSEINKKEN